MENGRVVLHGGVRIQHRRQHLVVHLEAGQRLFGDVRRNGRHGGQGMASVQHFFSGHDVAAVEPVVDGSTLFLVHHGRRNLREIGGGGDGSDSR